MALAAFVMTAGMAGKLSARIKRHDEQETARRARAESLQRLSVALTGCESVAAILDSAADSLRDALGARSIDVFDATSGLISRWGEQPDAIADEQLRQAATTETSHRDERSGLEIEPIRGTHGAEGSIGVCGQSAPAGLLAAVAETAGISVGKAHAARATAEAEAARRTDELKSAVFDALAHEARGPLGTIHVAVTALMSDRPGSPAQQREMLSIIKEEVDRMSHWIDATLYASQSEAVELACDATSQDAGALVAGAIAALGHSISRGQITVNLDVTASPVLCDPNMIQHVLSLLLDNAIKYSPLGSPISIASHLRDGQAVLAVADAGPGIADDEKTRIFEKGYRSLHRSDEVRGTGLGLSTAKLFVEANGGEIWVTDRPGGGAEFHFSLPVAREPTHENLENPDC